MKFIVGPFLLAALTFCPAAAITGGVVDENDEYPSDGALMIDFVERGQYWWGYASVCSGVLIHPKVFLTAAHCVVGSIFFDEEGYPLDRPLPDRDEDAMEREVTGPGVWVSFDKDPADYDHEGEKCATCHYIERAVVSPYYTGRSGNGGDVAVIILKDEYTDADPVHLPSLGYFDALKQSGLLMKSQVINVGYGAGFDEETKTKHDFEYLDKRMFSFSTLKSLGQDYIGLSTHANQGNGGTCYGDSGGSAYYNDESSDLVLAGITSWGDQNCISTVRILRLDVEDSISFITNILDEVTD